MSRVLLNILLISLFLLQSAQAQVQAKAHSDSMNTILFKINSQKHQHTSYLFGTHHAFGKVFFDSLAIANQALASSDLLIKENLNIPGEMAEDIINRRTEITQWKKYLSNEDLAYIENLFATSPTDYNKMTPTEMYVFLNRYFKQQVCLNKSINDTSLTLDDYIGAKAEKLNIELVGLETTEEQIEMVNKDVEDIPKRSHKRRLHNIIEKLITGNDSSCDETNWYSSMNTDYQLKRPCTNTLLLTDRNVKWMKTIKESIDTNNCFIAVGLSHLMYECGLINELKALGYTIEPIKVK